MHPGGLPVYLSPTPEERCIDVLYVDDSGFADVVRTELEASDETLRVQTARGVEAALDAVGGGDVDCLVTDYELADGDALELLDAVRATDADLPVILFTGDGSEAVAADAISQGVTDYLPYDDGEARLPALEERIADAVRRVRDERRDDAVRRWNQTILQNSPGVVGVLDADGEVLYGSHSLEEELGVPPEELRGTSVFDFVHPEDVSLARRVFESVVDGDQHTTGTFEFRVNVGHGSWRWFGSILRDLTDTVVDGYVLFSTDVTDRVQMETELRQNERRYRTLTEMAPDPIIVHIDGEIVFTNDAFDDLFCLPDDHSPLGDHIVDYLDPSEHRDARATARRTQAGRQRPTYYRRTAVTWTGEKRHLETTSRNITYQDHSAVLTIVTDVTEQHEYEHALQTLTENTRELMRADSRSEAGEIAVETCEELLDLSGAVVYEFDGATGRLDVLAASSFVERNHGEAAIYRDDGGLVWESFAAGESTYVEDAHSEAPSRPDDGPVSALPFESLVAVPIGTYGVLVAGSIGDGGLSKSNRDLLSVLTGNLEATYDRLETTERIQAQEHRLAEQNTKLTRLNRLNDVLRSTNRALVQSTSEEGIDSAVCDELVAAEAVVGAWTGVADDVSGQVRLETVRGMSAAHVDRFLDGDGSPLTGVIRRAVSERETQLATSLLGNERWKPYRRAILSEGYSEVAVVPIPVRDDVRRVLVLHISDGELFGTESIAVLDELGRLVGSAIETVGSRSDVLTDGTVQLDLELRGGSTVFSRFVRETGATCSLRGAILRDDVVVVFLSTPAEADPVRAFLESEPAVEDGTVLAAMDGEPTLFQFEMSAATFDELAKYDCRLQRLSADEASVSMTVEAPTGVRVRDFVEDLEATYGDVELTARRQQQRSFETAQSVRSSFRNECTGRQFEAIEAAHYAGFYEWPRRANNSELAAALGISSPTYQAHRRTAERKLISLVFGQSGD